VSREDLTKHYRTDASKMLDLVVHLPDQVEKAWRMMKSFKAPRMSVKSPVVLCGMGGSAIGGMLLRDLIQHDAHIPLHFESTYALPAFVDGTTPVVCVS
jgi:glucose/mannose-6-phosphate isomerase